MKARKNRYFKHLKERLLGIVKVTETNDTKALLYLIVMKHFRFLFSQCWKLYVLLD